VSRKLKARLIVGATLIVPIIWLAIGNYQLFLIPHHGFTDKDGPIATIFSVTTLIIDAVLFILGCTYSLVTYGPKIGRTIEWGFKNAL
jgi:hypothetical protein